MKLPRLLLETKNKFIRIRCDKCKNDQITFSKATTKVNCLVCGKPMVEPTGGKAEIKARILEAFD